MANTRRLIQARTRTRRGLERSYASAAGAHAKSIKIRNEPESYYEAPRSKNPSVTLPKFKCLED